MSSIVNKRSATKGRELPLELKYNCLKHLNDELMVRVKRLEELLHVRNGAEKASSEGCQGRSPATKSQKGSEAGDQTGDGLHVEQRGEDFQEQG
jgi:hypothetical protein